MRNKLTSAVLIFFIVLATTLLTSVVSFAGEATAAMKQMATIMHRLKHYPSPQGKEELKMIISNSTTNSREKVLATAMMNLEHEATAVDKPKLKAIMDDGSASQDEKALAGIIYNLSHRPSDADKAILSKMMK